MTIDHNMLTLSKPACPDIAGPAKQLFGKPLQDTFLNKICAGVVAAVGCVNPTGGLQYLFSPRISVNFDGNPQIIVGNASSEKGKFSLIAIDILSSCLYFVSIFYKEQVAVGLEPPNVLEADDIADTHWAHQPAGT